MELEDGVLMSFNRVVLTKLDGELKLQVDDVIKQGISANHNIQSIAKANLGDICSLRVQEPSLVEQLKEKYVKP